MGQSNSLKSIRFGSVICSVFCGLASQSIGQEAASFEGVWIKPCTPIYQPGDDENYDIAKMTFSAQSLTVEFQNYEDANCQIPFAYAPVATASANYKVGQSVTTADGMTATELDSHVTRFNGATFDKMSYSIIHVDGDTMMLGKETGAYNGMTPAARPVQLETRRVFERQ